MLDLAPCGLEDLPPRPWFLQSAWWGAFKAAQGWEARAFRVWGGQPLLVLIRRVGAGQRLAYVPHGPVWMDGPEPDVMELMDLGAALKAELGGALALRFDLVSGVTRLRDDEFSAPPPLPYPLKKGLDVQVPDTVLVDLAPEPEALLADMHKKTRYNIRLAERHGVRVEPGLDAGDLNAWYGLYEVTARRDRIAIHPLSYYRDLWNLCRPGGLAYGQGARLHLLLAKKDDTLLAGIWVLHWAGRATYIYGASADEQRELMPSYALQWAALEQARAAGCADYDFFGIPPAADEAHPLHGLWRFKTGFGGRLVHRHGAWDLPLSPLYGPYRAAEGLRAWYYKTWRKRHG